MGKHQIMSVPKEARRTSDWDMFATWVGANANNGTWFIGGVIAACGFAVAMKVLVLSSAVSYLFLSLIGYIGYKTGVSTMELSRASFGIRGSFLPSIVNVTQFIGWTAVNTFIAATSVSYLLHDLLSWPVYGKPGGAKGLVCGILVMSILHIISIASGQRSVQLIERIGIVLVFVFMIWESVVVFKTVPFSHIVSWQVPHKDLLATGAAVDAVAAFNLAWVTAGADFTRFTSKKRAATLIPFAGALFGVVWFAFIGLVSTISIAITSGVYDANNSDPSTIASRLGLGVVALLVIIITSMTANAVNLMAAGSAISNIFSGLKLKHSLWIAAIFATFVTFIPMVIGSFLDAFTAFLDYVGMVLGPIISVIIIDFYFRRHRRYDVSALSETNGKYWYRNGVNYAAFISWSVGVALFFALRQVDFLMETIGATFLTMILSGMLYYGLMVFKDKKGKC
ncbi:cytosine permease [Ligilactobacillus ruminis]|jgi:putative hydroxymethylpyrimidine transporter CytX|uniref:Purine-cytosine permease n=3 Tax=Ligilactobacillus ruminis TaxID=1623 RepID=G2SPK4_LIGR2|nr:cytosine permease [Ligilactobacillus ruminis]MCR5749044.1 cytosine permease [Lactobacillus sp.]AEN77358.1 Purine-cytosine permease [Ligilactobacillus ruminis ATCC 27782]KLA47542.1 Purine-cytosine permease [Ligilactobacillus ruminis]KRM83328.1 Purine-cytosine permease [Ligilactobacillus ruminis DSM 20403 = NBRC 102161]MDD5958052.1 cytosine permease [Ligilactobacillus ruminis]